jgi:hypothetical protein
MLDLSLILAGSVAAVAGSVFVYAKRHPATAVRMSQMAPKCSSCQGEHPWRDSGLCRTCESDEMAPMPDYE